MYYGRDMVSGRYNRPFDEVYQAAFDVVKNDGVIVREYVSHEYTNSVAQWKDASTTARCGSAWG